jgi:hypothetical protein
LNAPKHEKSATYAQACGIDVYSDVDIQERAPSRMRWLYTNGAEDGKQDKDGMGKGCAVVQGRVSEYPCPWSPPTCDKNAVAGKWQARLLTVCGPSAQRLLPCPPRCYAQCYRILQMGERSKIYMILILF